ncbi:unnamed protein product [Discula destructiva]
MSLAPAAAAGFQNATAYDAHRPAYPPAAVQKLLEHMRLADRAHARIVEVAAGTGKFTEALSAREEWFEVLATEPHPDMRRELEGKALRGVTVREGRAENLRGARIEEEWADGVVVAQAFHWFATEASLGEMHRVLKPGGVLGLIWNIDDYNKPLSWTAATAWSAHLNAWLHGLAARDDNKRFRDMEWPAVFDAQLKTNPLQVLRDTVAGRLPRFSVPLGQESVGWTHRLSEAALWRRISTLSHVAVLEGAAREEGERVFREAMAMDDVRRNESGEIECAGRTFLAWSDRL